MPITWEIIAALLAVSGAISGIVAVKCGQSLETLLAFYEGLSADLRQAAR